MWSSPDVTVVGGGLAGCEAAWGLAESGLRVALVEMRPARLSPAHATPLLAELVCSNSLRSDALASGPGLLKRELRRCGSLIIACADANRVPAGEALAVDRRAFSLAVTRRLLAHPLVHLERRAAAALPDGPAVIAAGPLVGGGLGRALRRLGGDRLHFYDAIAPIVDADSIDWSRAFRASRYDRGRAEDGGEGDYVNCPLDDAEYLRFVAALREGRKVAPRPFEEPRYFEGCLPIEVMAARGDDVLAFGPMKPVGLHDPRPGAPRPRAVVQLRAENAHATAYNLVGFQTRLAHDEQRRVFSLIPALARAEFLRLGSIHRNSYLDSPRLLDEGLALRGRPDLLLAGQLTGVEGYIESVAGGLLAGRFLAARLQGRPCAAPPVETALGGLHQHLTRPRQPDEPFTPTNVHFGLLPPLGERARRRDRRVMLAERALAALEAWA